MSETKRVGRGVFIPGNNLDTDQITPARYLKCVTFDELSGTLFYDERFDSDGNEKEHPINDPRFNGAGVLLVGKNFGCGSSREHAPQAIKRCGFKAIVGESFAEIFQGNCTALGVLCVTASQPTIEKLAKGIEMAPSAEIEIDIETQRVSSLGAEYKCRIDSSVRDAFLRGAWDPLDTLLSAGAEIDATFKQLPYSGWV
ncbi:MAG: 3-isopropylmalate dehydratase small subunit [Myxococcota bacterium]|nr:3-isopropylmalate dehydratase small subunit [Myxococcota bacterium]